MIILDEDPIPLVNKDSQEVPTIETKQLLPTTRSLSDPDDDGEGRQLRGVAIAARAPIKKNKLGYQIPSQGGNGSYVDGQDLDCCSCEDFELRDRACEHIHAVEHYIQLEGDTEVQVAQHTVDARGEDVSPKGPAQTQVLVPEPPKLEQVKYDLALPPLPIPRRNPDTTQHWPAYNAAQQYEGELFPKLLKELCGTIEPPPQGLGRPKLPLADMVLAAGLKVYSEKSGRRAMTDIRRARVLEQLDAAPSFNSVLRYLQKPELTPLLEELIVKSALPLAAVESSFAVDSSGFSTSVYNRWYDHKSGRKRKAADWVKGHIACGTQTNIITAAEVTVASANDCPYFIPLVEATAQGFEIKEVSADKAYLSKANLAAVAALGGQAYIPFKVNSTSDYGHHLRDDAQQRLWERSYHYYHLRREEFLAYYHKRSNVETAFSMIKLKFGTAVRAKSFTAQVNETLVKILCHNICVLIQSLFELGGINAVWSETLNTLN